MSTLTSMMYHPALSLVGMALLHFLWQGLVIGLAAYAAISSLRGQSANARYWTAVAFLLLMAAAPVITVVVSMPDSSRASVLRTAANLSSAPRPSAQNLPNRIGDSAANVATSSTSVNSAFALQTSWRPFIAVAWLLGVGWMSCRFLAASIAAIRLRWIGVSPAPLEIQSLARRLSTTLRVLQPWSIHVSTLVASPLVVGCLRPMILLPASTLTQLAPSQLEAILLHELAHLRRFDLWINQFQALIETLLFFHPAVWWLSRQVTKEREHCCDDLAVSMLGDRGVYVNTLLALAEIPQTREALAMSAQGKSLSARIARLYATRPTTRALYLPQAAAMLLVVSVILVVAYFAPRSMVSESRAQNPPLVSLPGLPEVPFTTQRTQTPGEIRVIVRNKNGNLSFEPELQLWYASKPTSEGPRPTSEWIDASGTVWNTLHSSQSKIAEGETKIEPPREGKFRVSAFSWYGSVGRAQFSPPFDWKSDAEGRRIELIMHDHHRLKARFIDKRTRKPIEGLAIRLFDEKGDIVPPQNAGNVNFVTDVGGGVAAALPVGKFQIDVRGKRTWEYVPEVGDYAALEQRIDFESTDVPFQQDKMIEVEARPLSKEEIDERWPWIVQGKVTDEKGAPLEGVGINVATGMGTLLGGTETRTAKDGSYLARFSQGIHTSDELQMQFAIVSAHSNWRYEANLNRQGAKVMARKEPSKEALEGFGAKLEDVFLPGKPLTIDFVIKPAEIVSGEVVDESGKLLEGYRVYLITDPLPPASSVFGQAASNANGYYQFLAVPADREFRLVVEPPTGQDANWKLTSEPIRFTELKGAWGGDHTYQLIIPSSGAAKKKKLDVKFTGFKIKIRC